MSFQTRQSDSRNSWSGEARIIRGITRCLHDHIMEGGGEPLILGIGDARERACISLCVLVLF